MSARAGAVRGVGVTLTVLLGAGSALGGSLAGWEALAENPSRYDVAVDGAESHSGRSSASLSCASCTSEPPATLMQAVRADAYRGRRVRLAAYVRSADVRSWAGLWMRVDEPGRRAVAFDNMSRRPITGTTPWTRHEVVLDVPAGAVRIAFGALLAGGGRVWVDDFSLTAVDASVELTDLGFAPDYGAVEVAEGLPSRPRNPSFEESR